MTENANYRNGRRLPKRDLFVLPLIALVTAVTMAGLAEVGARMVWSEKPANICHTPGPERPYRNCVEIAKIPESPAVKESYNECGYRGNGTCGLLPEGVGRVAVIGSSASWAHLVPFEDAWSAQAMTKLGASCTHIPNVQSLGGLGTLNDVAKRLEEAVALNPQLVILVITPFDIMEMPKGGFNPNPEWVKGRSNRPHIAGLSEWLKSQLAKSRLVTVSQHFYYGDAPKYVSAYLNYGDKADFLRQPLSPLWLERLKYLDNAIKYISEKLSIRHIPLMVVTVPHQTQADIVGAGLKFQGVNPWYLGEEIRKIAVKHKVYYVDGLEQFRHVKNPSDYYYHVDGHLNVLGSHLLGDAVYKTAAALNVPGLCKLKEF